MTDDKPAIELRADSFTVHAREKISTGDYENAEFHTTIEGAVNYGPVSVGEDPPSLDEPTRKELKARLLAIHKEAQETVERAAENRIAIDDAEDWGVHNGGDDA